MYSLLSPYLGQLTCGIDIDLSPYNVEDAVASTLVTSSECLGIDNMEVFPLHISIEDLRETNKKVYVEFKLTKNVVNRTANQYTNSFCVWRFDESRNTPPTSQIGNEFFIGNEEFIANLCSILWDIDPYKLKSQYCSFPNVVEQKFLNFNKPQSYGHKPKQLSIQTLSLKIDKLQLHLDRGYMNGTHMILLRNIVKGICDFLDKYVDYLKKQAIEVSKTIKQQFYLNLK